jgi:drug/metabolite transporter (DMT)-like permease
MKKEYLYLIAVVLLFALTPLIVPFLSGGMTVTGIAFFATVFSVLVLSAVITIKRKWSVLRAYKRGDIIRMAFMGAVGIFPYTMLYYLGFTSAPTEAGVLNIINYLWPIWILVLSVFILKEKLTPLKVIGILLGLGGIYIVFTGGSLIAFEAEHLPAYIYVFSGAFFWGLFSVLGKRTKYDKLTSMLVYNSAALVLFFIVVLLKKELVPPPMHMIGPLLLLGGGVNGAAYVFWFLAIGKGRTAVIASGVYLTPFVALLYLSIAGRNSVTAYHLLALVLIVAGPLLQIFAERKK